MLDEIAGKQGDFLTDLAGRLPRIAVAKIECRLLADSIYEIEILVTNTGFLPTALSHGETSQQVLPTRVTLDLDAAVLPGRGEDHVPARHRRQRRHGQGPAIRSASPDRNRIRFEVISTLAGRVKGTIELLKTE